MDSTSLPPPQDREQRPCGTCAGAGVLHEEVAYDNASGRLTAVVTECGRCDGNGTTPVFVYPKPRRATAACCGCGGRTPRRELIEVGPEEADWSLSAREGALLCDRCARASGVS